MARAPALPLLLLALLALVAGRAAAQSQGAALAKLQAALQPSGWQPVDANADACADPGDVTPGVVCDGSTVTSL